MPEATQAMSSRDGVGSGTWLPVEGSPRSPGWATAIGKERYEGPREGELRCGHGVAAFAPPRPEGGWSWNPRPGEGVGSGAQDDQRAASPAFPPLLPLASRRCIFACPPWPVEGVALLVTWFRSVLQEQEGPLCPGWDGSAHQTTSLPPALGHPRPGPSACPRPFHTAETPLQDRLSASPREQKPGQQAEPGPWAEAGGDHEATCTAHRSSALG